MVAKLIKDICGRPDGKHFFRSERFGRLRSYVRPIGAELFSAGPNEVRRPEPLSSSRALRSFLVAGCSWCSVTTVSFITSVCACQTRTQTVETFLRSLLVMTGVLGYAFANISARKLSPVFIIAQRIRASLLASATVTSRAGFFARRATIQSRRGPFRLPTTFSSDVAPKTSCFLMYRLPCLVTLPSVCFPPLEFCPVSYTHLRAHETDSYLVCRLL